MELKVGDRVNVYASFMSNEPLRGKIVDNCASQKDTILFKIRFDNFRGISSHEEWIHAQQCRKLAKKPIKFEVGDRCVIEIEGKKQKGTILHNRYANPDYYVKFDDGFHGFFPIRYRNSKCQYVRKLVNKRKFKHGDEVRFKVGSDYKEGYFDYYVTNGLAEVVEYPLKNSFETDLYQVHINRIELVKQIKDKDSSHFKFGDRVIFKLNGEKLKGRIYTIDSDSHLLYIKPDNLEEIYTVFSHRVKKLVKKKTEFKVGDRVIFKQSNCNLEDLKGYDNVKGTITQIRSHGDTVIALVPQLCGFINVKHLKKLVKKKKSEQKPFFEWMSKIILKDLEKESQKPELLPCPFCGCDDIEFSFILNQVHCKECGACGGLDDGEEKSIKQWNRRSYP